MTLSPTSDWNPEQYGRFRDERARPFFDLLDLVHPRPGMRVVDLGCGTGELTREMHRRLAARETLGIDNSPAMLAKTEPFAGDGLTFMEGDIGAFTSQAGYDLVFSNAALHWIPDHEALLRRLTAALTETGQLAVQVPANDDHLSHATAVAVAREEPFHALLGGHVRQSPVLAPEVYATLLHRFGYRQQHVRLQVYPHELESREAVVEWVRGSVLTDYERRLPEAVWPEFLARYRERLLPQLADTRPFFYPFKRILFWGSHSG
ncbi:MAG: methyltransferase domain-containing protein [Chloroflexota bacterium]|nr:methyltransferase domain-containing protein [Chloroflexia bacterium]MDQ3225426.1 methyltransferase domain-containing protein [Chloroflexota bacterium]